MTTPPDSGWGAPTPAQPQYGQPQYGQPQQPQYGQPQYGQPQYGQPGGGPAGFGQFQVPDKPGIIPLRPLRLGEFLDGAFGALRSNPRIMLGLTAVVISAAVAVATAAMVLLANRFQGTFVEFFGLDELDLADDMHMVQMQLGPYATGFVMMFVLPLITGLLITSVSRSVIGQKASLQQIWDLTKRKFGPLLLLTLLMGLAVTIAFVAFVVLIVVLAGAVNGWVAALFGILGGLGLVVALVWIAIRTLLVAPALVLEDARFWPAFKRSWLLSRGSFWRLLGIYLLTQIIVGVVTSVIVFPVSIVAGLLAFGSSMGSLSLIVMSLGNVLTYTITTAFTAAVTALLYIDLRMRREGLDVELTAAAKEQGN